MKGILSDKTRVLHVLDAITEIENYLEGISYQVFFTEFRKKICDNKAN